MSCTKISQEEKQNSCKPRFKGIENFLRRAAFHLGNSPSQTEVKIISCIPIDVTDLQHKILSLEKELYAARKKIAGKNKNDDDASTVVGSVVQCSSVVEPHNEIPCSIKPSDNFIAQNFYTRFSDCCFQENKSNIFGSIDSIQDEQKMAERCPSADSLISKWDRHKRIKNLFRKRKKKKNIVETGRGQTQMVYYATTDMQKVDVFSQSYLSNLFRKHHDPKLVVEEFSDTSHYSQPICRDVNHFKNLSPDSDICSCCHGKFHNLDVYMNDFNITCDRVMRANNKPKFNTSTMVDLIPVKENSDKAKSKLRNEDITMHPKIDNNAESLNINVHTKHRHHNHKEHHKRDEPITKKPKKNDKTHAPLNIKCKHNAVIQSIQQPELDSDKSCSIDCGNAYVKSPTVPVAEHTQSKLPILKAKNVAKNKISKVTQNVHSDKLKTAIDDCTKTEAALNEIKRILQSVLTEVKNNALAHLVKEEKGKKDAIVQKEASQNNIQQLRFPNYFAYNSSNLSNFNSPYILPYPGQLPIAQYCLPNVTYNPAGYPITPVAPPPCTCDKQDKLQLTENTVTTTSTNTDNEQHDVDSKETEKLIKEIYKSVDPNMEYPSKEISCECDELKSMFDGSMSTDYKTYDAPSNVSKVIKKDAIVEALLSTTTATTASNLVYTATSCNLGYRSKFLNRGSQNTEAKEKRMIREYMKKNYITEEEQYTTASTESEDNDIKPQTQYSKDNKKNGIIKSIFKSVFAKKKEIARIEEYTSDSDDYSTIYTEKAINTPQPPKQTGGISFIRPPAKQYKRPPYMDQEYRRQWNEDLIFQKKGHYTAKAVKTAPIRRRGPNEVYFRDYEARAAMVQPRYLMNYKLTRDPFDGHKTGRAKFNAHKKAFQKFYANKKISWLKKYKLGVGCRQRWKNFILNN